MAQVVVISVVFSNWGLGWSGLQREFAPLVGAVLFGGLVLFSRAWLTRFSLGPAEWVLRSVTYARLEALHWNRPCPDTQGDVRQGEHIITCSTLNVCST